MGFLDSILDQNLDEIPELQAVEGDEYRLEVISARVVPSKNEDLPSDAKNVALRFKIQDHPEAYPVRVWFSLPNSEDDKETVISKIDRLRKFCNKAGLEMDFEVQPTEDGNEQEIIGWEGAVVSAILDKEYNETYGDQNTVKRFLGGA